MITTCTSIFHTWDIVKLLNTKICTYTYTLYAEAQYTVRTYYSHIVCMGDEREDSPANYKSLTK